MVFLKTYQEEIQRPEGHTESTSWKAFVFDSHGRAQSFQQLQIRSDQPNITLLTEVEGRTFDRYGDVSGGTQVVVTAGSTKEGESVNLTQVEHITGATFQQGALTGYKKHIRSYGTDANLTWMETHEEKIMTDLSRDGYKETTKVFSDGSSEPHVITRERSQITRDFEGRLVSYKDKIVDSARGPIPTTTNRLFTHFDSWGRVQGSAEVIHYPNGEKELKTTHQMAYNSQGLVTRFHETTRTHKKGAQSLPENWKSLSPEEQTDFLNEIRETLPEGGELVVDEEKKSSGSFRLCC